MRFQFPKSERLASGKSISELFKNGKSFVEFPFRVNWKIIREPNDNAVKIAFSIPKKRFKKAVDRNKIRRRCKEAYRLNSNELKSALIEKQVSMHIMLIYISDEPLIYKEIEPKIILILHRLTQMNE